MRSKRAFVIFKDCDHWTMRFTKKGFGHCYLLIEDDNGGFIRVDANRRRIDVRYFDITAPDKMYGCALELELLNLKNVGRSHKLIGFFTCVSIIKYFLNVRCFAITPFQLYKKLLKMKGKQTILDVKTFYKRG